MIEWLAFALILLGVMFLFIGTLGVARFEDVYLRLQSSAKSVTFGLGGVVLGAAIFTGDPMIIAKALMIGLFQCITSPIAAQLIARSAMRNGVNPCKLTGFVPLEGEEARNEEQ